MENDIHDYYNANFSGQVQVLGCDQWNGSVTQLTSYKNSTGSTFPLLRTCSDLASQASYGISYDNYLVLDQNGVIRYISPYGSPLGQRYNLSAIRATIDGLTMTAVGDEVPRDDPHDAGRPPTFVAMPAVVRSGAVNFRASEGSAVRILTTRGAEVRRLPLASQRETQWDTRDAGGERVPAGMYLAVVDGGARVTRRIVVIR